MASEKWYNDLNDKCAHCGLIAGKHGATGSDYPGACPNTNGPGWYENKFIAVNVDEPFGILCQTCGYRRGHHVTGIKPADPMGTYCPVDEGYNGWRDTTFLATEPPVYKPQGWKPSKELTAALQVPEPNMVTSKVAKKMKTPKSWDQKLEFKTAKEPKSGLTYYKEVPVPPLKNACAEVGEVEDFAKIPDSTIQALKYYENFISDPYSLSNPSKTAEITPLSKQDILNAVESLKGANAKPFQAVNHYQFFGRGIRDVIEPEPPIEVLAEAYLRAHAPDKTLVQMLVGFAQSAENPTVRKLADELQEYKGKLNRSEEYNARLTRQRDEWHREWKTRGREIEALQDQMAGMVPKAVAKVPRGVEGNARKFRDA